MLRQEVEQLQDDNTELKVSQGSLMADLEVSLPSPSLNPALNVHALCHRLNDYRIFNTLQCIRHSWHRWMNYSSNSCCLWQTLICPLVMQKSTAEGREKDLQISFLKAQV